MIKILKFHLYGRICLKISHKTVKEWTSKFYDMTGFTATATIYIVPYEFLLASVGQCKY